MDWLFDFVAGNWADLGAYLLGGAALLWAVFGRRDARRANEKADAANNIAEEANSIAKQALELDRAIYEKSQRPGLRLRDLAVSLGPGSFGDKKAQVKVVAVNDSSEQAHVVMTFTQPSVQPASADAAADHDWRPRRDPMRNGTNGFAEIPANGARDFTAELHIKNPDIVGVIPDEALEISATTATDSRPRTIDTKRLRDELVAALGKAAEPPQRDFITREGILSNARSS